MKGKHDDLIMALAMALYVGESSFSQLQKADDLTKAMLNGWLTESNENNSIPSSEPVFGVVGGGNSEIKKQYVENSWLFTKRR